MSELDTVKAEARTWLMARIVIADFLGTLGPPRSPTGREEDASCLLARLASHDPPLFIATPDELKGG